MLLSTNTKSETKGSYQIVLDEFLRIVQISDEVNDLISFYDVYSDQPIYMPLSTAVTEKIHWLIYRWLEHDIEETLNVITQENRVISLKASVNEVKSKKGTPNYVIQFDDTDKDSLLKKKNRELKNELETFIYRTSHDMRGPLLSVLGCLQLIKMEKSKDPSEYLQRIEHIIQNLDFNMKEVTRQVFNRGVDAHYKEVDVSKIVDQTITNFRTHKNFNLTSLKIRIDSRYIFHSDDTLFRMILTNLLSNAFNYIDTEKNRNQITLIVKVEPFKLVLEVIDSGIGIDEAGREKVYDMFYRATNSSSGVGLGLYMTKSAVEDLRGDISFRSTKNKGTHFTIVLPNVVGTGPAKEYEEIEFNHLKQLN